ncbi:M50 family metallopeptidase [Micromonospora sp. NPDC049662]|uniref:M50 family metallopeptidase n=1 Tax=Micromonospora sp. NPDC049662 TaxID=3155397 RepID=UPI003434EB38
MVNAPPGIPPANIAAEHDRISTAVHEAGHAVVATLTGIAVRYATLAPRDGVGVVVLRPRRGGFPALESIAISCAGLIAEDVAGTDERWGIAEASQDGDVTNIRAAARDWHAASDGVTVLDLIARSWELAFDLVLNHYGAVLAVAEHLLSSRRALTGPQIRGCISSAPTMRPESVPADAHAFWIPNYVSLRNWGPAARRRRKAAPAGDTSRPSDPTERGV